MLFATAGDAVATTRYVTGTALGHSLTDAPGLVDTTKGRNLATE